MASPPVLGAGDSAKAATAALADGAHRSASESAVLCQKASGELTSDQRKQCSEAHLAVAKAKLAEKSFPEARDALAYAEMEGGPIDEIRSLRGQVPPLGKSAALDTGAEENAIAPDTARTIRMSAANGLTISFASSRLRDWDVVAAAAGRDCDILLITFYVKMEPTMIEALHRGTVMYGQIVPGGVSAFVGENRFRGVVYRDGYGTTWSYGSLRSREIQTLKTCQ